MDHSPSPYSTERSHRQAERGRLADGKARARSVTLQGSHSVAAAAGHCEVHINKEAPREVRAALEKQQGAAEWWRGSRNDEGSVMGEGSVLPPWPFLLDPSTAA